MRRKNSSARLKYYICILSAALMLTCGCGSGESGAAAGHQTASDMELMSENAESADSAESVAEAENQSDAVGIETAEDTETDSDAGADAVTAETEEALNTAGTADADRVSDTADAEGTAEEPVYTLGDDEIGMVLLGGLLYMDSGENAQTPPSGETITILTSVGPDEIPGRDRESNFGAGFQVIASADGKAYVLIGEEWHIFRRPGAVDGDEELKPPAITLVDPANDMLNGVTLEPSSYTVYAADAGSGAANGGADDGTEEQEVFSAEGMQPCDEEVLQLKPLRVRGVQVPYTLGCNVQPDTITLAVYSFNDVGSEEAAAVSEVIYLPPYYVDLDKGWIYAVRAEWSRENAAECGFYGEAEYIFTTY